MRGVDDLNAALAAWQKENDVPAKLLTHLQKYTDGYQATMEVTFSKQGVANKMAGTCMTIGVSTMNGGVCLVAQASQGAGNIMKQNGVQLLYFPGNMWND